LARAELKLELEKKLDELILNNKYPLRINSFTPLLICEVLAVLREIVLDEG
jgi:hypothetical protein